MWGWLWSCDISQQTIRCQSRFKSSLEFQCPADQDDSVCGKARTVRTFGCPFCTRRVVILELVRRFQSWGVWRVLQSALVFFCTCLKNRTFQGQIHWKRKLNLSCKKKGNFPLQNSDLLTNIEVEWNFSPCGILRTITLLLSQHKNGPCDVLHRFFFPGKLKSFNPKLLVES